MVTVYGGGHLREFESRAEEGAAVQNCLSRPEVGGWGRKSFSRFWLRRRSTGVALDVTLLTSGRGSSETRKPSALAGVGVTPMADDVAAFVEARWQATESDSSGCGERTPTSC